MSGAPIMIGTIQLPNPPIIAGMTMKKIMIRPWDVTRTLKKWPSISWTPGFCNSARNQIDMVRPTRPPMTAKIR